MIVVVGTNVSFIIEMSLSIPVLFEWLLQKGDQG